MRNISRVLVIHPFGIGDVLFATPMIARLKRQVPGVHVDLLCNRRVAPLMQDHPHLDHVWVLERDEYRALLATSPLGFVKKAWGLFSNMRARRYDLALDLSLSNQFGFLLMLMGVRRRVGYRYKRRGGFLNAAMPLSGFAGRHVADYHLQLLNLLGISSQGPHRLLHQPTAEAGREANSMLGLMGLDKKDNLVALAPGGGESWGNNARYKRWDAERFAILCDFLRQTGHTPVLLGSVGDAPIAQRLQQHLSPPVASLVGSCRLEISAAVLARCRLLIANDGGLLHLAVAQDVPTVSFFGPTDDAVYGPYPRDARHRVVSTHPPCRPCYQNFRMPDCLHQKRCLEDVGVEQVCEEIAAALGVKDVQREILHPSGSG